MHIFKKNKMGKVNTCCNPFGKKSHKSVRKNLYCIDLNSSSLFEDFIGLYICNSCRVDFYKKKSEADENDSVDDALSNVSFDLEEVDYKSKTSNIFIRNVKRSLKQAKTFHAKVQILSVLPNNFSNYKIRKIFNVSNRLASRSKKAKNNFGLAPLPMKRIGRKLPQSTIELVKKFYMSDEISRIMPGMKDCLSIKTSNGRELMQKRLLLFDLTEIFKKFKLEYSQIKIGLSKFKALRPRQCVSAGQSGTHNVCVCKIHQNVELKIQGLQKAFKKKNLVFNEKTEQFLKSCVCHSPSNDCFLLKCEQCPGVDLVKQNLCTRLEEASIEVVKFSSWCSTDR